MSAASVEATHCPPWCTKTLTDPHDGSHCHYGPVGDLGVQVASATNADGGITTEPMIMTALLDGLTAAEARQLAWDLMAAADTIDVSKEAERRAIGASVTACMVDKGVTPQQLAAQIRMTEGNLWRRLAGSSGFTAEDILHIAKALDVEVGVLLTNLST